MNKLLSKPLIALHSFLALTRRVDADVMVVEGWILKEMLDEVIQDFQTRGYKYIITSGLKYPFGKGSKHYGCASYADYCKTQLCNRGMNPELIHALPAPLGKHDRTYQSARAIKEWLIQKEVTAINVYSGGPHARKSWCLFKRALGKKIEVGIVSCNVKHYDPDRWWTSPAGIMATTRYSLGYLYAVAWPVGRF